MRCNLERQGRERLISGRFAGQFLLLVAGVVTDDRRDVQRVRQVVDTASSMGWTPRFLNAEPQKTG